MKILSSLVGLVLLLAGIYLTYWVFLDFESFETLYLGLYLGGAFILMTLGFYLFLLPLALKNMKSNKVHINKESISKSFSALDDLVLDDDENENHELFDQNDFDLNASDSIMINGEVFANNPIEAETSELDSIQLQEEIMTDIVDLDSIEVKNKIVDEEIQLDSIEVHDELMKDEDVELDSIELQDEVISDEGKLDSIELINDLHSSEDKLADDKFEIIELRVIGIDSWSSQSILRKLNEQSHLELNQKAKSGINMTQVTYKHKLIGYISRLDMNKLSDKLDLLMDITPSTLVKEGRKIEHFSINLKFKLKEKSNE